MTTGIKRFFEMATEDARVSPVHISLYMALVYMREIRGGSASIHVFSYEVMPVAKIYSVATYHRCIHDLHQFGYIQYEASCNRFKGSRVGMCEC